MNDKTTPIILAKTTDVPEGGSIIVLGPNGLEIALFKLEGKIHALENVCPHQGGPLGEGDIVNGCVTCPWHGWRFDIKSAECDTMPGESAKYIPIEIVGDEIRLKNDER